MAKRKKKGSTMVDRICNIVDSEVEEGNGTSHVEERTLRVQKRCQRNTDSSQQQNLRSNEAIQQEQSRKKQVLENNESIQELGNGELNMSQTSEHTVGPEDDEQQPAEKESSTKDGRGPAQLPIEWNSGKKLDVKLNAAGQIVGDQYHVLASSIGCLARVGSAFPITAKTWRDDSLQTSKQDVWKEVEENTNLPEAAKRIINEMLNTSWRLWKHRVKLHYKKYKHDEDEMVEKLDERVVLDQFLEAIKYWNKPEVEEQANINTANRGQTKFPHRTGRTPFSEIVEELHVHGVNATQLDVWLISRGVEEGVIKDVETAALHEYLVESLNGVPPEERTDNFRGNLYETVVRKEKRGRATCLGRSIHKKTRGASSSATTSHSAQDVTEIREELNKLKIEREELSRIKEELKQEREKEKEEWDMKLKQANELIEMYGPLQSSSKFVSCSQNNASQEQDTCSTDIHGRHGYTASSTSGLLDVVKVNLFCFEIPKVIVAEGRLVSTNPEDKVGGLPIGPDYVKIFVESASCPEYKLCRPLKNASTVGQAIRKFVVWPKSNVMEK